MTLLQPPVSWNAYESNQATAVINPGTVVTADVTIHTKNATYTQLIASTSFDAYAVSILGTNVNQATTATSILADIAIGAAAAESVIIPNLNFGAADTQTQTPGGQLYWFPLYIPAGSRISATAQSLISADTVNIWVRLYGQPSLPVWAGSAVTAYGVTSASSLGTSVVTGVSAAEGAYTQITASTTYDHSYIAAGVGPAADTTVQGDMNFIDIGVGAATESTILTDGVYATTNAEAVRNFGPIGTWANVPASSRLAARISRSGGTAETHDVILYGVS